MAAEKTVSVKLSAHWIERLDKLTKKGGVSRHQLLRNLIKVGMDDIDLFSKIGLFEVGLKIRDLLNLKIKPEPGEEKPLPLKLEIQLLEKIDRVAEKGSLSRHQLMRNLIHLGIEEMERASKVGILQVSVWMRDFQSKINQIIQDGRKATEAVENGEDEIKKKGGETT